MDQAQFQDLVDRHGEDLTLWPASVRADAEALLRQSAKARSILDAAAALRGALTAGPAVRAPAGLKVRIVALADEDEAKTSAKPPAASPRLRAGS